MATFHESGKKLLFIMLLNIIVSCLMGVESRFFITMFGIPSGPLDVLLFRFLQVLLINDVFVNGFFFSALGIFGFVAGLSSVKEISVLPAAVRESISSLRALMCSVTVLCNCDPSLSNVALVTRWLHELD